MARRDVHLLDLVLDDHDEPGDDSIDGGHGRIADPVGRASLERLLGPNLDQFRWNQPEMTVLPSEVPDLGDVSRILGASLPKGAGLERIGGRRHREAAALGRFRLLFPFAPPGGTRHRSANGDQEERGEEDDDPSRPPLDPHEFQRHLRIAGTICVAHRFDCAA